MERKSDKVRRLVADGDFKGALRIAKDFRLGITKEQSSTMTRAYSAWSTEDSTSNSAMISMRR